MYGNNEPTGKQINAIRSLAKRTFTDVDVDSIATKQEASEILDDLIAKRNGKPRKNSNDDREKKVVYGLAVKLVFTRYQQLGSDYKTEEFWKEVNEFYQQYLERQDRVLKLGS